jgi:hypothetical protein
MKKDNNLYDVMFISHKGDVIYNITLPEIDYQLARDLYSELYDINSLNLIYFIKIKQ